MANVHAALQWLWLRNSSALGRHHAYIAHRACGQFWHIAPCRRLQVLAVHYDAFSPSAGASSTVEDTFADGNRRSLLSNDISNIRQLPSPSVRLTQLEKVVEEHGRSLTSLASRSDEHKQVFATILRDTLVLKSDSESKVPTSIADDVFRSLDISGISSLHPCTPPWPEWASFLQHLKELPFCKESIEVAEFGSCIRFDDSTTVKRTLAKFSQVYESIFDSLSMTHLRDLAVHGCPNDDRRTMAAANRLRNYFQIDETRNSCDSKPASPKLSDVLRLIYTIAEVGREDGAVKLSALHLLKEIISMTTKCRQQTSVDTETVNNPDSHKTANKLGEAKTGPLCGGESMSQHDEWKCPRCFTMNWQSNCECIECSLPLVEKSPLDIHKVETQGNIVAGSKKAMDNDRQAATPERPRAKGLENVSSRLLAAQGQEWLQKSSLPEEENKDFGGSGTGLTHVNVLDEHSDCIFDDIFDSDDPTSSPKADQNTFMTCSLSDLVRDNKKAFLSPKREKGAGASGVDDSHWKGGMPANGDVRTSCTFHRAERDDLIMEAGDKGRLPDQSSVGTNRKPNDRKTSVDVGGSLGRTFDRDSGPQPQSKGWQLRNRPAHSSVESKGGARYTSGKMSCHEGSKFKEKKAEGRYTDVSGECGSKTEQGGGFGRKAKKK